MDYKPKPVDTENVELPPEVVALVELLAKNTHDNWSRGRLAEGWRYGPARDDERREHPGLVPYEELPEAERNYDRTTALETVKTLLALGYRIEAPGATAPLQYEGEVEAALDQLEKAVAEATDLAALLAVWRAHDPSVWRRRPRLYTALAGRILKAGEPLIAYDVLSEGLRHTPRDVRLRQLQALALSRSGATERANVILTALAAEGNADEETLGMLARTHKDLWERARAGAEKNHHLRMAFETYARAYRTSGGYYTGINAATTALLSGREDEARAIAREVRALCLHELSEAEKAVTGEGAGAAAAGDYWLLATLGEAALVLGEGREADEWYGRAAAAGRGRFGELISTRRNARLLVRHTGADGGFVERHFSIPRVVVFAGHAIDRAGRAAPRFPEGMAEAVRRALGGRLAALDAGVGYSSATCGSDLLFVEEMLARGAEAHVVLPYSREQFKGDSVAYATEGEWVGRFDAALARSAEVLTASEQRIEGGHMSFEYATRLLEGLAAIRAQQLETELVALAVWDGRPSDEADSTHGIIEQWRARGRRVEVVNLREISLAGADGGALEAAAAAGVDDEKTAGRNEGSAGDEGTTGEAGASEVAPPTAAEFAPQMMALLFADAVNFSKLSEEQVPLFIRHFLGSIGELVASSPDKPVMKNTWGDGLYFVFDDVGAAGRFALKLCELINRTGWEERGLPKNLNLRIGLHAGPVYQCIDPVTRAVNYIGSHVSRAARIEPVTPPGQVYTSQAFAALAAAQNVTDFRCEYVGQTPLPKGSGTIPTYVMRLRAN